MGVTVSGECLGAGGGEGALPAAEQRHFLGDLMDLGGLGIAHGGHGRVLSG